MKALGILTLFLVLTIPQLAVADAVILTDAELDEISAGVLDIPNIPRFGDGIRGRIPEIRERAVRFGDGIRGRIPEVREAVVRFGDGIRGRIPITTD